MINHKKIYQLKLDKKPEKQSIKTRLKCLLPKEYGKTVLVFSVFALFVSFFMQLYISNVYAVKGSEMVEFQNKQSNLEMEVSRLHLEVSEVSSLAKIEKRAEKLGFVEMNIPVKAISSVSAVASNL